MNELILDVNGLKKSYVTPVENLVIFEDLDLQVFKGESVVIAGKSGSGKSTLLNIIGGLDHSDSGSVIMNGCDISKLKESELTAFRQKVLGFVFQFHHLLKDFTALENIFLPAYMAGMSKKNAMEKARALLADVGLSERASHLPAELSGGERQRVAVARALINDPQIVLADEPTGNLDPENAVLIGELLFNITRQYQKTLIMVTHDMNLAKKGSVRYFLENKKLNRE
ncbi:ABC transporter ATP-binding protein [Treponema rectale]|uniref:ABC transporter ATP-binding protein n=1 Tax=Treponema rectale TaxID=744512 RepID=A0A840S5Y2_9SPIR|nr:ABC transporter ATP-binding protein [Treponema rectale]MBB5217919.1 lipoprotein-releasing system ATP-binding protein [Treponema rectale]QOS40363.1 ABC transporter ATP-binding protein [Treponema rectale]